MTQLQAVELAQQLEELIYIGTHHITGPRRDNCIRSLADALVAASEKQDDPACSIHGVRKE
jgi:hypothetical protein